MAKIIFLGTAAMVASPTRDNTSFLIVDGAEKILIDTPGSIVAKLARVNIDYRKISNIIFTHAHTDHIYGLPSLLHSRYRLGDHIAIYAHPKTISLIEQIRKVFKLKDNNKFPELKFYTITTRAKQPFYDSASISISRLAVHHAAHSVGLKIIFKKKRISCIVSGDTRVSSDLIKAARGCDYLIHDCTAPSEFFRQFPELNSVHTSSLSLGRIAKKINPRILIPIHFGMLSKSSIHRTKEEIRRHYKGKMIIPRDLQILQLNARPSGPLERN